MYYKNIISEMRQSIFYNTSLNENTLVNGVPYKVYVNFLDYIINYFQNDIEFNCFYNTYIQYVTLISNGKPIYCFNKISFEKHLRDVYLRVNVFFENYKEVKIVVFDKNYYFNKVRLLDIK